MKLRNKKTGEIDDYIFEVILDRIDLYKRVGYSKNKNVWHYNSLAELYDDWEDYEAKEYWIIDWSSSDGLGTFNDKNDDVDEFNKSIGNYFETKEEAEKAVEKLKAWKRLKDKGFRFTGINDDENSQELITQCGILCEADIYHLEKDSDFLLLFGDEE